MAIKTIRNILATLMFLLVGTSAVSAQDLLARQAPVDKKMRALDTLSLRSIMDKEEQELALAEDLYDDWDNIYAHRETAMPDRYKIDLRHFCMPTVSRAVTSNFGARWGRQHKGIDIKVYVGDTIRAAFTGKVRIVRFERGGYGNYVVIRHGNGLETIYAHMSKHLVKENQEVRAGDPIGLGGNTGRSSGSHLHFETRLCGVALNPALMFDFRAQDVVGDYYDYNKDTYARESAEANRLRGKIGNGGYTAEQVRGTAVPSQQMAAAAEESVKSYHKVAKGETLSAISRKRGVTIDKLCKLNGLTKKSKLRPGQILRYS